MPHISHVLRVYVCVREKSYDTIISHTAQPSTVSNCYCYQQLVISWAVLIVWESREQVKDIQGAGWDEREEEKKGLERDKEGEPECLCCTM